MSKLLHNGDRSTSVRKYVWVCLLLPLLFLCNPFQSAPGLNGSLSLLHPPSYRATVASSELLKFKNPDHPDTSTFADCEESEGFLPTRLEPQSAEPRVSADEFLPAGLLLSGNVWFRPPPAA
jgi:hypothetical protein